MDTFNIPFQYTMSGVIEVEAETLQDAINYVEYKATLEELQDFSGPNWSEVTVLRDSIEDYN